MSDETRDTVPDAALERAWADTRAAFENRALIYHDIFEALSEDVGRERAAEIMKRGLRRRGVEVGRKYRDAIEAGDLRLVGCIFCSDSACDGTLFHKGIESFDGDTIVLRMESCPLVDAWRGAGLSAEDVDLMCEIAAEIDEGTFGGAGLELTFLDRQGRAGSQRCLLQLRLPAGG